jgi:hypothetical protein
MSPSSERNVTIYGKMSKGNVQEGDAMSKGKCPRIVPDLTDEKLALPLDQNPIQFENYVK